MAAGSIPAWAGETPPLVALRWDDQVYPRVGGGNQSLRISPSRQNGLSPRGRGKRRRGNAGHQRQRSIPAWAGETPPQSPYRRSPSVYPRVGGGNRRIRWGQGWLQGLSPRGRGKHRPATSDRTSERSIPAWAGETSSVRTSMASCAVYPRVGGGNNGEHPGPIHLVGLSPRGRGKPKPPSAAVGAVTVYPRVGGGNIVPSGIVPVGLGLSPRGRGKREPVMHRLLITRSIPAWAGETDMPSLPFLDSRVYPRVGGGNSGVPLKISDKIGLSPRGRGKRAYGAEVGAG